MYAVTAYAQSHNSAKVVGSNVGWIRSQDATRVLCEWRIIRVASSEYIIARLRQQFKISSGPISQRRDGTQGTQRARALIKVDSTSWKMICTWARAESTRTKGDDERERGNMLPTTPHAYNGSWRAKGGLLNTLTRSRARSAWLTENFWLTQPKFMPQMRGLRFRHASALFIQARCSAVNNFIPWNRCRKEERERGLHGNIVLSCKADSKVSPGLGWVCLKCLCWIKLCSVRSSLYVQANYPAIKLST